MSILMVGPGQSFATTAAAVGAARDGDVIEVRAGTYENDSLSTPLSLSFVAIGGRVREVATVPPANGKGIWDIGRAGATVTVRGFDFSGAAVPESIGGNAAGIRTEGGDVTLVEDGFHDNQEGVLAASDPAGRLSILRCAFIHNGSGTGYTHNLYVNAVRTVRIEASLFMAAVVGHEIKSRAGTTIVQNTRILDTASGTGSYLIDLPNGGRATIADVTLEKGKLTGSRGFIAFGEEGGLLPGSTFALGASVLVNHDGSAAVGVLNRTGIAATVTGIRVWNLPVERILSGPGTVTGTVALASEPTLGTGFPWAREAGARDPAGR